MTKSILSMLTKSKHFVYFLSLQTKTLVRKSPHSVSKNKKEKNTMVKKIKFFIFFVIMGLCAFSYAQNTHPKLDALERLFEKVLSLEIDVDHYESGTVSGILKLSAWNELSDFINQDEDASLFNELRSSLQEWGRLFDAYAELHDEAIDLVEKVDAAG